MIGQIPYRHSLSFHIGEGGPEDSGCPACEEGVDGEEEYCRCWDTDDYGVWFPNERCALCRGKGTVVRCRKCGQVR